MLLLLSFQTYLSQDMGVNMPFKPFSLSEAISGAQTAKFNQLKLQSLQADMDRQRELKDLARMSTAPVYGEAEGPPTRAGVTPQIQTGEQYDPQIHQQKLAAAGELDMATKMQGMIGKMNKMEREEYLYNASNVSKLMADVTDEQTYNERQQVAIEQGFMEPENARPFSPENVRMIQNVGRTVADIYSAEKTKGTPFSKINPKDYTEGSIDAFVESGNYADLVPIVGGKGSSEFERLTTKLEREGLTKSEQSRYDVLAGMKARPSTAPFTPVDIEGKGGIFDKTTGKYRLPAEAKLTGAETRNLRTTEDKQNARYQKATVAMRKEATEGVKHFQSQRVAVSDAIAALESGDNALADTLIAQVMSQVQDTNVRAFQMYSEFDRSYGNLAERVFNSVSRFMSGSRTPEERQVIKDTLLNFKKYSDPAANQIRNKYRALAREEGLDPFRVMPPDSPEDIKNAPNVSTADKLKLLKTYYPGMF